MHSFRAEGYFGKWLFKREARAGISLYLVVAGLTEEGTANLLHLLNKLNRYHKPIFEGADGEILEGMLGLSSLFE